MKKTRTILIGICLFFLLACEQKSDNNQGSTPSISQENVNLTPLEVVNARMDLYNQHDFPAFLQRYHKDVKIYTYPNKLLGTGSDRLASIFEADFEKKALHVEIINQISNGNYVINHEMVTYASKETKYVSIYEVKNGLITSVRFVRD